MDENGIRELQRRLLEAEVQIRMLTAKVGILEREAGISDTSGPPPVLVQPNLQPQPPVERVTLRPEIPQHPVPPLPDQPTFDIRGTSGESSSRSQATVDDLEYKIGMTGLIRGGAVIVILGLLYLVALGISRGWITLQVQFAGEVLLCLGFIGLGVWKRTEREEFGQILTGIGSCGLYFSFAGAHVYKQLFEGETLVGLFLALSILNLGYSLWQSSRSFLVIGLVGGLVGSTLPMKEDRALLTAALHFLILLPTTAIIVRNRWRHLPVLMWFLSAAALMPVFLSAQPWAIRLAALYGASVVGAFAYAKTHEKESWDPRADFLSFVAAAGAIGGMLLDHSTLVSPDGATNPTHGTWQVLILSALFGAMAAAFRGNETVRNAFLLGSIGIAAILSPIGLDRTPEAFTYLGISVVLACMSVRWKSVSGSWLAWITYSLALVAYISPWSTDVFLGRFETAFLLASMVGAGLVAWGSSAVGEKAERAAIVASMLILPMTLKLAAIWIYPEWGFSYARAFMVGLAAFSIVSLLVGRLRSWSVLVAIGSFSALGACYAYLLGTPYPIAADSGLVIGLAALVLGATSAAISAAANGDTKALINGCAAIVLSMLWTRLSVVQLGSYVGEGNAACAGLVMASLAASILGGARKWTGTVVVGWLASGLSVATLFFGVDPLNGEMAAISWRILTANPGFDVPLLAGSMASVVMAAWASRNLGDKDRSAEHLAVLVGFPAWTTLWFVVLTQYIGTKGSAALTVSWIGYAGALIAVGFALRMRNVRLWSFAVFGLTTGKVILLDLAYLDSGIRVVILLALGMAMLAGGYWYIRTGTPRKPPEG